MTEALNFGPRSTHCRNDSVHEIFRDDLSARAVERPLAQAIRHQVSVAGATAKHAAPGPYAPYFFLAASYPAMNSRVPSSAILAHSAAEYPESLPGPHSILSGRSAGNASRMSPSGTDPLPIAGCLVGGPALGWAPGPDVGLPSLICVYGNNLRVLFLQQVGACVRRARSASGRGR